MRLGILGANGQVGIELCEVATLNGATIDAPSSADVDISDERAVAAWVRSGRFDAVVNCAAYTAVDAAENDRARAFAVNGDGPGNLGRACASADVPVIHLSTDFVFDGTKATPYVEEDAPNPLNVYGASKLAGERAILDSGANAIVLRVAWVFSAHRKNFVKAIIERARGGGPLRVVDDQIGGPCSARVVARSISSLIGRPRTDHHLYHLAAKPTVSRHGFAHAIVESARIHGLIESIPPVERTATTAMRGVVARPLNSAMAGDRLLGDYGISHSDWRSELAHVIATLAGDSINK